MSNGTPRAPSKTQKAGEAGIGVGLGGGVVMLLSRFYPELTPAEAGWISAAATALITSGASFLRRVAHAYDLKFLKVLLGIGLVVPFLGCTGIGPLSGMPQVSGDSLQDVAYCSGNAQVWYGEVEEDEDGILTPSGEGWLVECRGEDSFAYWHMGESANAELYKELLGTAVKAAVEGASPAP